MTHEHYEHYEPRPSGSGCTIPLPDGRGSVIFFRDASVGDRSFRSTHFLTVAARTKNELSVPARRITVSDAEAFDNRADLIVGHGTVETIEDGPQAVEA